MVYTWAATCPLPHWGENMNIPFCCDRPMAVTLDFGRFVEVTCTACDAVRYLKLRRDMRNEGAGLPHLHVRAEKLSENKTGSS